MGVQVMTSEAARWEAVVARDRAADGAFVFGVKTTGVYCRPSCGARRARREHVSFHATPAEARAAGLRACRRCRPDEAGPAGREAALVAAACRTLDAAEAPMTLAKLAEGAGLSPHHFHRLFRRVAGVTPRAYAGGARADRMRAALGEEGASVTEAVYAAGFSAPSRFYAAAPDTLGMAPADYAKGGKGGSRCATPWPRRLAGLGAGGGHR